MQLIKYLEVRRYWGGYKSSSKVEPAKDADYYENSKITLTPTELANLSKVEERKTKISKGDKVFFTKSATFPRNKFRYWAENLNVKITRSPEKADIIIYDDNVIKDISKKSTYDFQVYKNVIEKTIVLKVNNDYVTYEPGDIVYQTKSNEYALISKNNKKEDFRYWYGTNTQSDIMDQMNSILISDNKILDKFMSSATLATIVMTDSRITNDDFINIRDMLNSKDQEMKELGVNLLSDFNWSDSMFYMCLFRCLNSSDIEESDSYKKVALAPFKKWWMDELRLGYRGRMGDYYISNGTTLDQAIHDGMFEGVIKHLKEKDKLYTIDWEFIKTNYIDYINQLVRKRVSKMEAFNMVDININLQIKQLYQPSELKYKF